MSLRTGLVGAAAALLVGSALVAAPALAAEIVVTKTMTGTIALPAAEVSSLLGAGTSNATDLVALRQTCPGPGNLDGVIYKWFDLKGDYTRVKVSGPETLFSQEVPVAGMTVADYDLDLYAFDSKCNLQEPSGSKNAGGASENVAPRKPARYVAVVYYAGAMPNIPVKVEATTGIKA